MKLPKDQPFLASVLLHVTVLLAFLLVVAVQYFMPKDEAHIFEVFDLPNEPNVSSQQEFNPVVEEPTAPPLSNVNEPTPEPEPSVSYEDYLKKNPIPDPKPRVIKKVATIKVPQISVSDIVMKPNLASESKLKLTDQQISAISQYNMRLRATIDAAWTKPEQIAGINLSAEVTFYVSSYGRLSNPHLTKSSGYTAFDRSIISAITRANNAGPTPTGQGYECSLTFVMND